MVIKKKKSNVIKTLFCHCVSGLYSAKRKEAELASVSAKEQKTCVTIQTHMGGTGQQCHSKRPKTESACETAAVCEMSSG